MDSNNNQKSTTKQILPTISLSKGGGAIKSIDEKFSVNPSNGTSSLGILLPFSKSRSEFIPSIGLNYNSGNGNGVFGLGWDIDLPYIQRKTNKQLPQYKDEVESDIYIYSGLEDLVLYKNINENVKIYRPRIDNEFYKIERIKDNLDIYWKVTTKENVVTIYGKSKNTRIYDPEDNCRVFKWLPEISYDDKGNCIEYEYIEENLENVEKNIYEKNRHKLIAKFTNRHLKSIKYGNKTPYYPSGNNIDKPSTDYFFEVVFKYYEKVRKDSFSTYTSGFEIRTYKLCEKILFYHNFDELNENYISNSYLVKSIDFNYKYILSDEKNVEADYIISIEKFGYRKISNENYDKRSFPKMEFDYNELNWSKQIKDIKTDSKNTSDIYNSFQWIDYYSEGISGIFKEEANGWYYKSNLGEGNFTKSKLINIKPSFLGINDGSIQIQDLEANGEKYIVSNLKEYPGYFKSEKDGYAPFQNFKKMPNVNFNDPYLRFIDLTGDGKADIVISEDSVFTWYESKGKEGYENKNEFTKPFNEELGPKVVFSEELQSVFLADMNGDGLVDIVRIRNNDVCYWPNMGYGKFGAKISMGNSPLLANYKDFNPIYLKLVDISGTGASDIIYLGQNKFRAWINLSGNAFSEVIEIDPFMSTESPNKIDVIDILGNGTPSLVWSSTMPKYSNSTIKYIDLMGGKKPYIMNSYKNNLGMETKIFYKSSTQYYLEDKKQGKEWITKLPFPVQCVSKINITDSVSESDFTNIYKYHHGYYDYDENEFRGFGMVEQIDSESYEDEFYQKPVLTKTWYHVGAYLECENSLNPYEYEYYKNTEIEEYKLPHTTINIDKNELSFKEIKEAVRSCKGKILRQEVYSIDGSDKEKHPYTVTSKNYKVNLISHINNNKYAIFSISESESITYNYERNPKDPRINHDLNLEIDEYLNVLKSARVYYERLDVDNTLDERVKNEQGNLKILVTDNKYTNDVIEDSQYRLRNLYETSLYQLKNANPQNTYFKVEEILDIFNNSQPCDKILLEKARTLYLNNDLLNPLPLGTINSLGLKYETYKMVFTNSLISQIYEDKVNETIIREGKYISSKDYIDYNFENEDTWWIPSGTIKYFEDAKNHFYLPHIYVDPYKNETKIEYYNDLLIRKTTDSIGNTNSVEKFDFRVLLPEIMKDMNDNLTEVKFDILGFVVGTCVKGKNDEGDNFNDFKVDLTQDEIEQFFENPKQYGRDLIKNATNRIVYDFKNVEVAVASSILRETHYNAETLSKLQYSFEYSDGLGNVAMKTIQAEPGMAKTINENGELIEIYTDNRWVGTGRKVLNNKGNLIIEYESYFSTTHKYEKDKKLIEIGYYKTFTYDPINRIIRTDFPEGTFSKVEFDSWSQRTFDVNDTVKDSVWYDERINGDLSTDNAEKESALKSEVHYNTYFIDYFDNMGRLVFKIEQNAFKYSNDLDVSKENYNTFTKLDIQSNILYIEDSRVNKVIENIYDMNKNILKTVSMDSGSVWFLKDTLDKIIYKWSVSNNNLENNYIFNYKYDSIYRPTQMWIKDDNGLNNLYEEIIYGENTLDDKTLNLRGQIYKHYDTGGILVSEKYDFKYNLLKNYRQIIINYKDTVDWSISEKDSLLELKKYYNEKTYDALNRITSYKVYDEMENGISNESIEIHEYNEANLLDKVILIQENSEEIIKNINYNAKGQRTQIDYGNNIKTTYKYNPKNYRLTNIKTIKNNSNTLQDLNYTYDPIGNITQIEDKAQDVIINSNYITKPINKYTYDALYKLIEGNGREDIGDGQGIFQNYTQRYKYDSVGNIRLLKHCVNNDCNDMNGYTREYFYNNHNNRLNSTKINDDIYNYGYDLHGSIISMPHLQAMEYNFKDELSSVKSQNTEQEIGDKVYYIYDFAGNRIRKVVEMQTQSEFENVIKKETLYLDNREIYKEYIGQNSGLERNTLNVMDDKQKVCMVESRNEIDDGTPVKLIRYLFNNNINSVCLEADEAGNVISYEEYYPFGCTSYKNQDSSVKAFYKRYRYVGKEKDDENGFYYFGARYYISWLGRWLSADPIGIEDGLNVYSYVRNNPINSIDKEGKETDEDKKKIQFDTSELDGTNIMFESTISKTKREELLAIVKKLGKEKSKVIIFVENKFIAAKEEVKLIRGEDKSVTLNQSDITKNLGLNIGYTKTNEETVTIALISLGRNTSSEQLQETIIHEAVGHDKFRKTESLEGTIEQKLLSKFKKSVNLDNTLSQATNKATEIRLKTIKESKKGTYQKSSQREFSEKFLTSIENIKSYETEGKNAMIEELYVRLLVYSKLAELKGLIDPSEIYYKKIYEQFSHLYK